jgi:hypothetical protein
VNDGQFFYPFRLSASTTHVTRGSVAKTSLFSGALAVWHG